MPRERVERKESLERRERVRARGRTTTTVRTRVEVETRGEGKEGGGERGMMNEVHIILEGFATGRPDYGRLERYMIGMGTDRAVGILGPASRQSSDTESLNDEDGGVIKIDELRSLEKDELDNYILLRYRSAMALERSFRSKVARRDSTGAADEDEADEKKGEDAPVVYHPDDINIDMDEVKEAYDIIEAKAKKRRSTRKSLNDALLYLMKRAKRKAKTYVHPMELKQILVMWEHPQLTTDTDLKDIVDRFVRAVKNLPARFQKLLSQWFDRVGKDRFKRYVDNLHHLITIKLAEVTTRLSQTRMDILVASATSLSILHESNQRVKRIPYDDFHNDTLCSFFFGDVDSEYAYYCYKEWRRDLNMSRENPEYSPFSLISYSFLLTASAKSVVIDLDSKIRMHAEREMGTQANLAIQRVNEYFILEVRREHIVEDTMEQLRFHRDFDFRKKLKVVFHDEPGEDQGGLQKEFFQVVTRELFDPNYAMFDLLEDTQRFWFNGYTLEADFEFELIGSLLGIAIYNSIIVDLRFPMIVYKKLKNIDYIPDLEDLRDLKPGVATSMERLLEFEGDFEKELNLTFSFTAIVLGEAREVDLIPHGFSVPVTKKNREEYVSRYIMYNLKESVEKQFSAFHRGFHTVMGTDALQILRPEDLELLICGNPVLDFEALENATTYEGGYSKTSKTIRNFWGIVLAFEEDQKRKLLQFVTGSDRAPINGLATMKFVIQKDGGDSNFLPRASTCYNTLLLPPYKSRERLQDRLDIAINHQNEGFGLR